MYGNFRERNNYYRNGPFLYKKLILTSLQDTTSLILSSHTFSAVLRLLRLVLAFTFNFRIKIGTNLQIDLFSYLGRVKTHIRHKSAMCGKEDISIGGRVLFDLMQVKIGQLVLLFTGRL